MFFTFTKKKKIHGKNWTFISKPTKIYFIKSFFYFLNEIFLLHKICSEGPTIIIKFHFYEGPSMFISKRTVACLSQNLM